MPGGSNLADRRKARSKNGGHRCMIQCRHHKADNPLPGCITCRIRKVKCDERRPICKRCENGPNRCEWLEPGKPLRARARSLSSLSSPASPGLSALRNTIVNNEKKPASPADSVVLTPIDAAAYESPRPALSAAHIPLANSLQLSPQEQSAFLHIPGSILVLSYGKLWPWSCFSYIYTHIANQYPGVMRGFIAVASMELRASHLLVAESSPGLAGSLERARRLGASAAMHYSQALKDLSSLLDHICQAEEERGDMNALFTMWFLILKYETYLDADSATSNMDSGQFCLDFLSRHAHDCISHEHLFLSVRSALPKIWGDSYPVSELLDDLENYRPLRLYHLCQGAKLELLRLARSEAADDNDLKRLWRQIESFGDEFADILLLANKTPDSGGKRLMWTVYSAALDYHALQILCSSFDAYPEPRIGVESSLAYIFTITTKAAKI
ncbi:hypothetical protein F66182_4515 [Fusarium sp. NRRL 66182]|nr:hypothetical protein F66182_4515 [Fusarium sp. NRRL 66182]